MMYICALYKKKYPLYSEKYAIWSAWKLMYVRPLLPWIVWSCCTESPQMHWADGGVRTRSGSSAGCRGRLPIGAAGPGWAAAVY
jgi:hypothetical protein